MPVSAVINRFSAISWSYLKKDRRHEITRLGFQCRAIFPKILRSGHHHLHVILILAAAFLLLLNNRRFQIGRGHHIIIIILCVAWAPELLRYTNVKWTTTIGIWSLEQMPQGSIFLLMTWTSGGQFDILAKFKRGNSCTITKYETESFCLEKMKTSKL